MILIAFVQHHILNEEVNKQKLSALKILLISTLVFIFNSCATPPPPVAVTGEAPRVYETKAQIKNGSETNTVKIQIALLPNKAIRLEVTGTLGVAVASVLVIPPQIKIALHLDKSYISGPFNEKTLYPVFKQNISPRLLWKIIHDQSPAGNGIACQVGGDAKPISCESATGLKINWTYEGPVQKRIDIKNDTFEMNWIFKDQLQLPEYQSETFVLKKPESYKEISIK